MTVPMTDEAEPTRMPVRQRPAWRSVVVWSYLCALLLLFCVTFAGYISQGLFRSPGAALFSSVLLICDALTLMGFYAYQRLKPFLSPIVWRVIVSLLTFRLTISSTLLASNLLPWTSTGEQRVALAGLLSTLFSIPLLVTLWRYGSRSCAIWSSRAAHVMRR